MNFTSYIARRYLFTKSSKNAINWLTYIAIAGVIASSLALFVVLSAFSGLKEFSLEFSGKLDPDLKVFPASGKRITLSNDEWNEIKQLKSVSFISKVIEEKVLLQYKNKTQPAILKGVDTNYININNIKPNVVFGSWLNDNNYQVVMGNAIARRLSVGVMDNNGGVKFLVPKPGEGQIKNLQNAFSSARANVKGVFRAGESLDKKYVFCRMSFAEDLLDFEPYEISALELKLSENADEELIINRIRNIIKDDVVFKNRLQLNDQLYKMLNTENLAIYLVFTLVIIIALFNVVGALIMAILEKRAAIKTLDYIGATGRQIQLIFFKLGFNMTFFGGCIGLLLGILLVLSQYYFEWMMITANLAYPVNITLTNILIVLLTITLLGVLASYIASSRVKKVVNS
ncbi:MAG: FtsX-like permease family protein [Psychroflexus sp.]|nr:FtsX-like permease family protein [Psychroflexus sp.]MDR9447977.1 FtsX-like permease family protein [Psychroflexus sp.]